MIFMWPVLVLILLHLRPSWGSEVYTSQVCHIEENYSSPFVVPYYERFDRTSGCISQEKTSDAAEVHVISLAGAGTRDNAGRSGDPPDQVILHIQPRQTSGIFNTPLIFILHSEEPVTWRVQSDRISNSTRNRFVISTNARIVKDDNIKIKITKESDLPSDAEALASWTRQRYNAITSFTQFTQANVFFKKVGSESSDPTECMVKDNFSSMFSLATYLERQPSRGCTEPLNMKPSGPRGGDIYVIELHSATDGRSSSSDAPVVIDIQTTKPNHRIRNIKLVIKSHDRVQWAIRTRSIRGEVQIITDGNGDVDSSGAELHDDTQVLSLYEPKLNQHSGTDLLQWVTDKYGGVLSYIEARVANKFDLKIDGQEQDVLLSLDGSSVLPADEPLDALEAAYHAVNEAKHVMCQGRGIEITLNKRAVRPYGIRMQHLTLLDEACKPHQNATHYIFFTQLRQCNTIMEEASYGMSFKNAIMVRNLIDVAGDVDGEEGSADFDIDETRMDDEDYLPSQRSLMIAFQCPYVTKNVAAEEEPVSYESPAATGRLHRTGGVGEYELSMFQDAGFNEKARLELFPHAITDGQTMFVEAKPFNAEADIAVVVENCWLSDKPYEPLSQGIALIEHRCIKDNTLQWYDTATTASARFSFRFTQRGDTQYLVYMRCDLAKCSRHREGHSTYPSCDDDAGRACVRGSYMRTTNNFSIFGPVTVGPLVVMPQENIISDDVSIGASESTSSGGCRREVHMQGLDSPTVIAIAFAAFVIGALLIVAVWYIHAHTGMHHCRLRKAGRTARSTESSGESTPSSTAPITIHQVHT